MGGGKGRCASKMTLAGGKRGLFERMSHIFSYHVLTKSNFFVFFTWLIMVYNFRRQHHGEAISGWKREVYVISVLQL